MVMTKAALKQTSVELSQLPHAALQLNSRPLHHSSPRCARTLPLSATLCISLNSVVTTLPHLPCCTVSSPCSVYIFYLVVFSLDLTYFHQT